MTTIDREAMMQAVIDASPDPIFVKTQDNRYVLTNRAFLQVCGLSHATGKMDTELFDAKFVDEVRKHDTLVLTQGQTFIGEERLEIGGLWRTFAVTKFPVRAKGGEVLAMGGIASDITLRQEAEATAAHLRLEHARIEAANEAKSRLLSTVSHELRAPLAGIVGMSELLSASLPTGEARERASHIERAGRDLLRIINDLLDLSRAEAGRLEIVTQPFALGDELEAVRQMLTGAAEAKGLALRFHVDPSVPAWVVGDAGRVRQVLVNLVGNAIKFSTAGTVAVRVTRHPGASDILNFCVSDEGIGMTAAELERIFLPFEQTPAGQQTTPGGSGLGLPISRNLVELMGGRLTVRSRPGQGSVFDFGLRLPPSAPPAVQGAGPAEPTGARERLSGRVLVIDDCATTRLLACALLTRLGLDSAQARDGATAVEQAAHGKFDAVLMDYNLPDDDGPALARRLQALARGQAPPVIGLSASAAGDAERACLAAGMVAYLVKPVSLGALRSALATCLPLAPPRAGEVSAEGP